MKSQSRFVRYSAALMWIMGTSRVLMFLYSLDAQIRSSDGFLLGDPVLVLMPGIIPVYVLIGLLKEKRKPQWVGVFGIICFAVVVPSLLMVSSFDSALTSDSLSRAWGMLSMCWLDTWPEVLFGIPFVLMFLVEYIGDRLRKKSAPTQVHLR